MLYYWRMGNWEAVQQAALGSHGIITFAQAKVMGIFPAEMYRWCRDHLQVSFGCAGGQHRSVYFAKRMAERLAVLDGVEVEIVHSARPYCKMETGGNRQ